MDINIIDNQFNYLGLVDEYKSLIINKSYHGVGSLELHLHIKNTNAEYLQKENIVFTTEDKAYIILYRQASAVEGTLVVRGLEVKSYLTRWLVFPTEGQEHLRVSSNIETIMKTFVNKTLERKAITDITVAENLGRGEQLVYQARYKNLAGELEKLSISSGIGWDIKLDLVNKRFVFDIVEGQDRTIEQSELPSVIFSTEYDNISNQELIESRMDFANVAVVAGQGEGVARAIEIVGDKQGLESYEIFVDARDIEDNAELSNRGRMRLSEVAEIINFDSEAAESNLVYGQDFNLGDLVTNQSKDWNITINRRIVEATEIYEETGYKLDLTSGKGMPTIADRLREISSIAKNKE